MSDEYRDTNKEYHRPPLENSSESGSVEEFATSVSEYSQEASEYIPVSPEYTSVSPEYWDEAVDENTSAEGQAKERRSFKQKNKLVYFTASVATSFVVFSASLGGGLFGPGNNIFVESGHQDTEDVEDENVPGTNDGSEDIGQGDGSKPGNSGNEGNGGNASDVGDSGEGGNSGVENDNNAQGKYISAEYTIQCANNYLISFLNTSQGTYGLMDYDGNVLFSGAMNNYGQIIGPNDMGYTLFNDFSGDGRIEIVDATGKLVYSEKASSDGLISADLGDCDVIYEYRSAGDKGAYCIYRKVDGTVVFDSRQYTDANVKGHAFRDGMALLEVNNDVYDEASSLVVIDYSGNVKELSYKLGRYKNILGVVGEYFMTLDGYEYTLIRTSTGEVVGTYMEDAFKDAYGLSIADVSGYTNQGVRFFTYGTKAVIAQKYLVDFAKMGANGLPTELIEVNGQVEFVCRDYLAVGMRDGEHYLNNYVDWNGNFLLSEDFHYTEPYNSSGYALVFDESIDNGKILVINSSQEFVHSFDGRIDNTRYYGDFTAIKYNNPYTVRAYYYYGTQTAPNTKYMGPVSLFAGDAATEEIPEVEDIKLLGRENPDSLKALSDQIQALRTQVEKASNSYIAESKEISEALIELLTYSEALYYIACTDNATMTSYQKMIENEKNADLGWYYLQSLIDKYETTGSFYTYFTNNYMGYHTGPPAEAVRIIEESLAIVENYEAQGIELTVLHKYALDVSRELIEVYFANCGNVEKLFAYMQEYAKDHPEDTLYQNSYAKESSDIETYLEVKQRLVNKGLRDYGTRTGYYG